jgi:hypothetical protein
VDHTWSGKLLGNEEPIRPGYSDYISLIESLCKHYNFIVQPQRIGWPPQQVRAPAKNVRFNRTGAF